MQQKQATGIDTRMMVPVYAAVFSIYCQLFLPWLSIPALKAAGFRPAYSVGHMDACLAALQDSLKKGSRMKMPPFTQGELQLLSRVNLGLAIGTLCMVVLLVICAVVVLRLKSRSIPFVRIVFSLNMVMEAALFAAVLLGNLFINHRIGRAVSFQNLTVLSFLQLTSWVYAQFLISLGVVIAAPKLLDVTRETGPQKYIDRTMKEDRGMGKRTRVCLLLILVAIPLVIFFGIYFLNDRSAVFIGLCIICLAMLPFAMVFEDRKPQARELLLIAVMSGIAVAGRMAFFMLPQFKPVTAVVIIAGMGLGAEAGFLTGAMSGFVSNFFFGQGPWTPWQMFSFGIIGFLAGLIFHRNKRLARAKEWVRRTCECVYGGLATMLLYGLIMDFSTIMTYSAGFSWELLAARIISGIPFNLVHAASTVIFLLFLSRPMERKLNRIKKKYGILEA